MANNQARSAGRQSTKGITSTEFITTFHFKNQPTLTKFILDIKKVDGVEQKRSNSASFIIFDLTKLKQYLITTYNINFDITEDDINDDNTSVLSYNLLDK